MDVFFTQATLVMNIISIIAFVIVMIWLMIFVFQLRREWVNRPAPDSDTIIEGLYEAVDRDDSLVVDIPSHIVQNKTGRLMSEGRPVR